MKKLISITITGLLIMFAMGCQLEEGSAAKVSAQPENSALKIPVDVQSTDAGGPAISTEAGTRADPVFNPRADVNMDGSINILDLSLMGGQYGMTGDGLVSDTDENRVVDIFDLVRASSAYGTSASRSVTDPVWPNFDILSDFMSVGKDDIRGPYIRFAGGIGLNPFGNPAVTSSYYVVKDQTGSIAARGTLPITGNAWDIVLRKDAGMITAGLLNSFRVNVSVYIQAPDGHWAMNTRDISLRDSIGTLLSLIK